MSMTVGQLMARLEQFDPDLEVAVEPVGCGCCSHGELRSTGPIYDNTHVHGEWEYFDGRIAVIEVTDRHDRARPAFDVAVIGV